MNKGIYMNKGILRSFKLWSSLGYKIKKNSKAIWINDEPLFSEDQVVKLYTTNKRNKDWLSSLDHDHLCEYSGNNNLN
jgi:hypothetical protein